uniref:hypothetical protein n=1 Tax=Acinetobacter tandoii TaxID=202954 RepID=UPI003F4996DF
MAINLAYQNDNGEEFAIDAQILHPHDLLETWIGLSNPRLTNLDDEIQSVDISQINLTQMLETIYNSYLPGLRVLSTKIFFLGERNDYNIKISYDGQGIFNTQTVRIRNYSLETSTQSDYRINHARDFVNKLTA